jgi:hypothetical protein
LFWGPCLCAEIAMRQSHAAALLLLALMIGIAAAAAGSATARDKSNAPDADAASPNAPGVNATNAKPSVQANVTLSLSDAQRQAAWQDLYMDSLNQSTPPGFDAVVGATIVIVPVTAQARRAGTEALFVRDGSEEACDRQSGQPQDRRRDRALSIEGAVPRVVSWRSVRAPLRPVRRETEERPTLRRLICFTPVSVGPAAAYSS